MVVRPGGDSADGRGDNRHACRHLAVRRSSTLAGLRPSLCCDDHLDLDDHAHDRLSRDDPRRDLENRKAAFSRHPPEGRFPGTGLGSVDGWSRASATMSLFMSLLVMSPFSGLCPLFRAHPHVLVSIQYRRADWVHPDLRDRFRGPQGVGPTCGSTVSSVLPRSRSSLRCCWRFTVRDQSERSGLGSPCSAVAISGFQ